MVESCICYSCGSKIEFSKGELHCGVLSGWFIVSYLRDIDAVDRYAFCSLNCLQKWVASQATTVPEVFLESLGEESNES